MIQSKETSSLVWGYCLVVYKFMIVFLPYNILLGGYYFCTVQNTLLVSHVICLSLYFII